MREQDESRYDWNRYPHPSVPADLAIFAIRTEPGSSARRMLPERTLEVLLVRRGGAPYQHCWALPGGFSKPGERIQDAARRELESETGLTNVYTEFLGLYDEPNRDPRGWVIAATYFALVKGNPPAVIGGDDAYDAGWVPVDTVLQWPKGKVTDNAPDVSALAFDHRTMIEDALGALRRKLHTSLVARELLPESFTLAELYQVIQVIDPSFSEERPNFMRKLLQRHLLEQTGTFDDRYSQRPARLYRFTGQKPPLSIYQ